LTVKEALKLTIETEPIYTETIRGTATVRDMTGLEYAQAKAQNDTLEGRTSPLEKDNRDLKKEIRECKARIEDLEKSVVGFNTLPNRFICVQTRQALN
jgi:predicted RNase H-like nuclease (RuvC/YqgF family)